MRLSKKQIQVDILFKPNAQGISEWIKREAIDKTSLNWGGNGNCRHGIYFGDNRFIWKKNQEKTAKLPISELQDLVKTNCTVHLDRLEETSENIFQS